MESIGTLLIVAIFTLNVYDAGLTAISLKGFYRRLIFYDVGKGIKLNVASIGNATAKSNKECVRLCMQTKGCMSINIHFYSVDNIECHLLPVDQYIYPDGFKEDSQWNYMDTGYMQDKIGPYCQSFSKCPCSCGRCIDHEDGGSHYTCKFSSILYKSCRDLLQAKHLKDSDCLIKPDFVHASVPVRCKEESAKVWTIFKHNSSREIFVNGFEAQASYKHTLKYQAELGDIIKYVNLSIYCQQETFLKCYDARFLYEDYGWLVNRNGEKMKYFGGGPSNGSGCACSITKSCYNTDRKCNCDSNDLITVTDQGFVTERRDLPITAIRLGDTGDATETIYYRFGNLMCHDGG